MATIHISKAEAERDLAGLLARVDKYTTFVIESDSEPIAVLQAVPARSLSLHERIARLPNDTEAVMDESFARDVESGIRASRDPIDSSMFDE
jgi:hypothetical protein